MSTIDIHTGIRGSKGHCKIEVCSKPGVLEAHRHQITPLHDVSLPLPGMNLPTEYTYQRRGVLGIDGAAEVLQNAGLAHVHGQPLEGDGQRLMDFLEARQTLHLPRRIRRHRRINGEIPP